MARNIVTTHRGHLVSRVAGACAHIGLSYPASAPVFEPTMQWANGNGNLDSQDKREQRVAIT